ncbi:MAG: polysaccharide biosynthesis C-terminal domain-containing protein [Ignavibacteriaceae bacterium]|nr:polysaccharide biosynthesis C-terminal domain-containing protein [Ignavibacteriaceae bacterium]
MKQKFASTIAGASIFISMLLLLSRGLGFIREIFFANNFGLEKDFDLYLVGAVLPVTINVIILYIGQNFFVPAFQKINSLSEDESQKYYNQSFILFIGAGTIITLLLFFFIETIIDLYMHTATIESKITATNIFRIFLFTIPFSAGISMLSALLQTVFEFKYPSISVLFLNISIISMLIIFTNVIGIYVIPVGYLIGTILQFYYLILNSRKYFKLNLIPHFRQLSQMKSVFSSSILIILLIETISQLYSIFDRYFYSRISSGGIASLNYAYLIFILPITIFSLSLATVVFPKITKALVDPSNTELERIYNESISINIFIFMPITFILFYFGDTIIKIAFERGKFLAESTSITYTALKCYSVSIVFLSVYTVLNKIFYSLNLAKVLLAITIVGITIKLILNFILVENFQQYGLATSTSISYLFFFLVSFMIINNKLKIRQKNLFFKDFFVCLINCCICFLVIFIIKNIMPIKNIIIEMTMMVLFVVLYLLNLLVIKHKSIAVFENVLQRTNLSRIIKA